MPRLPAAVLLLAAWPAAAGELPGDIKAELARVEASAQRSQTYRTLLAENDGLPRLTEALPAPDFVRFLRAPRRLAYDPARIKTATEWGMQTATARELAKAGNPLAVTLVETEAAAWIRALRFALELAAVDKDFSKALAGRAAKAKAAADAHAGMDAWTRVRTVDTSASLPADELERLAFFAAELAHSPDRFYEAVGQLSPLGPEICRLGEVADFLLLHGAELERVTPREGQLFTVVAGARYPTRVVRAAKLLLPEGGAEYAKEALGALEEDAGEMSKRLRSWLKFP